jgi:hypothetical protein
MPLVAQHKVLYARALKHAADLQSGQAASEDLDLSEMLAVYANVKRLVLLQQSAEAQRAVHAVKEAATLAADLKEEREALHKELERRKQTDADTKRLRWIDDLIAYQTDRQAFYERRVAEIEQRMQAEAAAGETITSSTLESRPASPPPPAPDEE